MKKYLLSLILMGLCSSTYTMELPIVPTVTQIPTLTALPAELKREIAKYLATWCFNDQQEQKKYFLDLRKINKAWHQALTHQDFFTMIRNVCLKRLSTEKPDTSVTLLKEIPLYLLPDLMWFNNNLQHIQNHTNYVNQLLLETIKNFPAIQETENKRWEFIMRDFADRFTHVKFLLAAGANPNYKAEGFRELPVLYHAFKQFKHLHWNGKHKPEIFELLQKFGANINFTNAVKETLLDFQKRIVHTTDYVIPFADFHISFLKQHGAKTSDQLSNSLPVTGSAK